MAQRREQLQRIRVDASQIGVGTAFSPNKMPEHMMQKMDGAFVDFRGTIRKLPKRVPKSGTLLEPTKPKLADSENVQVFETPTSAKWLKGASFGDGVQAYITGRKTIYANITKAATGSPSYVRWDRSPKTGEAFNVAGGHGNQQYCSFQFSASQLPLLDPGWAQGGVIVRLNALGNRQISLALSQYGLYYESASGVWDYLLPLWQGLNVLDGRPHTVEFWDDPVVGYHRAAIDGVKGVAFAGAAPFVRSTTRFLEVDIQSGTSVPTGSLFTCSLWNFMLRDNAADPSRPATVKDALSRDAVTRGAHVRRHHNFLATEKYLWVEIDNSGIWQPLAKLAHPNTFMVAFKERVLFTNYGVDETTTVASINSLLDVQILDDAPNLRGLFVHDDRVWGYGDQYQQRIYFSGRDQPNVWFSPDTDADGEERYDEVLQAGFLVLQGAKPGEKVTGAEPNYYGTAIIFSAKAAYQITGSDVLTYGIRRLSDNITAYSQRAITRVGNDVWAVGPSGIGSIQTTQKFGDLLAHKVSLPIQDVFTDIGRFPRAFNEQMRDDCTLLYNEQTGLVYLHYAGLGSDMADSLWIYNTATEQWYGPSTLRATCLRLMRIGYPNSLSVVRGVEGGSIEQFTTYEEPTDSVRLIFSNFDGRSVNPLLSSMDKTWRYARIYLNPRGQWDMTVKWRVPGGEWKSETRQQADSTHCIEDLFTVGDSLIGSDEDMSIIEIDLDKRGKALELEIEFPDSASISIHSVEVDFSVSGYERG